MQKRIKILEERYVHGTETFYKGNTYPVDAGLANALCQAGMAEDVDGVIETAARDTSKRVLIQPDSVYADSDVDAAGDEVAPAEAG